MSEPAKQPGHQTENYSPKEVPEIVRMAARGADAAAKNTPLKDRLSEITLVDLPKCRVASYEVISDNPEQEGGAFIEAWIEKHGLRMARAAGRGDNGVVRYGFDCHKGRDICGENTACAKEPKGCWACRIYHQYVTLPGGAAIAGDDDVAIKDFPGGRFARVAVRDPFTCDFPSAWYVLLKWTFKHKVPNRLGCKSKKDCYSLFSNEESPCLEELYWEDGVQYMAMYLPVASPESYSPKEVPEIVTMAQSAQTRAEALGASRDASSSGGSGIVPVIHPLISDNAGENYWFNGCMRYVMEALGEPDCDYWLFGGVTGDNFTQIYALKEPEAGHGACAVSDCLMGPEYAAWVFDQVGYACEYVTRQELLADREGYLRRIMDSIGRGVPVICSDWGVFVGYEDEGRTLLFLTHEWTQPKRVAVHSGHAASENFVENIFPGENERGVDFNTLDLIFAGEKVRDVPLAQIYREAIQRLPALLTARTDGYIFGAGAFRAWADDIERGKFDDPAMLSGKPDLAANWCSYTNYVCVLATNGSCCHSFLEKAKELGPDLAFLDELSALYRRIADMWLKDKDCLEKLGGGFNIKYKTLQKRRKRAKIVAKIREMADVSDEILALLNRNLEGYSPKEKPEIIGMAQQAGEARQEETAQTRPAIVTKKFLLAGFEAAIDLKDEHWPGMDRAKAALKENLHKLGLAQPPRFFDVWEADPGANYKKKKNHSRRMFFFGAEVTSLADIPEGFVTKEFPETTFALFREREHGSPKFTWLEEAGYKFDTRYAEKYAMDMEIYDDIDGEEEWDALIPIEKP